MSSRSSRRVLSVSLSAIAETDTLTLEVLDDGIGASKVAYGTALLGVRERVASVGGLIAVDGSSGFSVRIDVPLRGASQ